jgi:hypothetical protein
MADMSRDVLALHIAAINRAKQESSPKIESVSCFSSS